VQTKFNYAWGLIKSAARPSQQLGVSLLSDLYRTQPSRRRECLYYLALGNYKLANYAEARRFNDRLLAAEPGNLQAKSLEGLIDERVQREGLVGVAVGGGGGGGGGVGGEFVVQGWAEAIGCFCFFLPFLGGCLMRG
jgi:fission 1 protein